MSTCQTSRHPFQLVKVSIQEHTFTRIVESTINRQVKGSKLNNLHLAFNNWYSAAKSNVTDYFSFAPSTCKNHITSIDNSFKQLRNLFKCIIFVPMSAGLT